MYEWLGATPDAVALPSPKLQAYAAIAPSTSLEPAALKLHNQIAQLDVNTAVGSASTTETNFVTVAIWPAVSITPSVTL